MQFLAALAAFFKAVPYLEKWGASLIQFIDDWKMKRAAKELEKAIIKAEETKDTSEIEKILRGD